MTLATATAALVFAALIPQYSAEAEKLVRDSVYRFKAVLLVKVARADGAIPIPYRVVDLPPQLIAQYRVYPGEVLETLRRIVTIGNPRESALAAGYVFSLVGTPSSGVVCIEYFDAKTYDKVDSTGGTLRRHWQFKVQSEITKRARLASR